MYNGTDRWETAESENLTWEHCETFYLLKQNDSFMDYLAEHYRSKYWGKKNMIIWKSIINLMILQRVFICEKGDRVWRQNISKIAFKIASWSQSNNNSGVLCQRRGKDGFSSLFWSQTRLVTSYLLLLLFWTWTMTSYLKIILVLIFSSQGWMKCMVCPQFFHLSGSQRVIDIFTTKGLNFLKSL